MLKAFLNTKKGRTVFILLWSFLIVLGFFLIFFFIDYTQVDNNTEPVSLVDTVVKKLSPTVKPSPSLPDTPPSKTLAHGIHVFQRYNNCGPAALSMALSYYGVNETQEKLGQDLRPYQVASGDNDDKSVTLEELAEKSKDYGFTPLHRPVGSDTIIKQLIAHDLPVITRTWTTPSEDIGHYRIIKGYDETGFIQDDSLQGKDIHYSFSEFDAIWKQFNYEFLVLAPEDKIEIVEQILGENADRHTAWKNAVENARSELTQSPEDIHARFNLSVALYEIGDYEKSVAEFEQVESKLSFRTLWYQIEPIQAYYELENYDRVFEITDKILNNQNRAFSELYIIRGDIYKNQGKIDLARAEYEKAVLYNKNSKNAQNSLSSVN